MQFPLDARQAKLVRVTVTYEVLRDLWLQLSHQSPDEYERTWSEWQKRVGSSGGDAFRDRFVLATMMRNQRLTGAKEDALSEALELLSQRVAREPGFRDRLKDMVKREGYSQTQADAVLRSLVLSSPVNMTATPAASSSPVNMTATPAASSSPVNMTATPTVSSPVNMTATPAASSSPVNMTSTPTVSSPVNMMTATPAASSSPVNMMTATPAASSSPVNNMTATPAASASPVNMTATPAASSPVNMTATPAAELHQVGAETEANFCAARDEIQQFVQAVRELAPDLAVFASHPTWRRYVDAHAAELDKILQLRVRNTPECRRVVEEAQKGVNELTRLVEQAYVNMMRYEAQNTINSFRNPSEYEQFMLSLAVPMLPGTVAEAQKLSKLRVQI